MEQEWIQTPHVSHGFKDALAPSLQPQCSGQLLQANRFGFIQLGKRKLLSKTESTAEHLSWLHLSLDGEWSVLGEVPSLEAPWDNRAGHWKESTTSWHFILILLLSWPNHNLGNYSLPTSAAAAAILPIRCNTLHILSKTTVCFKNSYFIFAQKWLVFSCD